MGLFLTIYLIIGFVMFLFFRGAAIKKDAHLDCMGGEAPLTYFVKREEIEIYKEFAYLSLFAWPLVAFIYSALVMSDWVTENFDKYTVKIIKRITGDK